jgi:SEA/GATOR complex protein SEA3/WDR59
MGYMTSAGKVASRTESSTSSWLKGVQIQPDLEGGPWTVEALGTELSQVSLKFPNVDFEEVNISERTSVVSLSGPFGEDDQLAFVRLRVRFPEDYPERRAPVFELDETTGVDRTRREEMKRFLDRIGYLHVRKGRPCVEACLRYLLGEKSPSDTWKVRSGDGSESDTEETTSMEGSGSLSGTFTREFLTGEIL